MDRLWNALEKKNMPAEKKYRAVYGTAAAVFAAAGAVVGLLCGSALMPRAELWERLLVPAGSAALLGLFVCYFATLNRVFSDGAAGTAGSGK